MSTDTPSGTSIRQLSVFLINRVGSLLALVKLLQDHSIEVLGLSMQDSTEMTLLRLILSDPDTAQMLFIEKGIPHTACDVVVVEFREAEGKLAECLAALLAAELNIEFAYPLLVRPNQQPIMTFHVEDSDMGRDVLLRAGFRVLMQEDLSR